MVGKTAATKAVKTVVGMVAEMVLTSVVLRETKKVFQPVGVTFKGGGFYKTDSRGGTASSGAASSTSTTTTPSTNT
mgnify:CR=1 FL=1